MDESKKFLNLINELVQEQVKKMDTTIPVIIESENVDGTVNIYIPPDRTTIIQNVINASKYSFKSGDGALLYKVKNELNNSFIIAKNIRNVVSSK